MSLAPVVILAAPISTGAGPGLLLRLMVVGVVVGVLLFVWLLARANRDQ